MTHRPRRSYSAEGSQRQRWLLSFADLMTLLFAFFLVLYASSGLGSSDPNAVRESLRENFGGRAPTPSELDELVERMRPLLARLIALEVLDLARDQRSLRIVIRSQMLFQSWEDQLNPRYDELFRFLCSQLQGRPLSVVVEGHTDQVQPMAGTHATNLSLSSARAAVVADRLRFFGLGGDQLSTAGFGGERPISDNLTAEGRRKNRRIVLRIEPRLDSEHW